MVVFKFGKVFIVMHSSFDTYVLRKILLHIKVYGSLRMSVKMLLIWNSKLKIDGGADVMVGTSLLEVRNLMVLRVCNSLFIFSLTKILSCLFDNVVLL